MLVLLSGTEGREPLGVLLGNVGNGGNEPIVLPLCDGNGGNGGKVALGVVIACLAILLKRQEHVNVMKIINLK